MPHTLEELERAHKALAAAGRTAFTLRMRRALSWLRRSREAGDDDDVGFICLWIAFNAAYAQDLRGLSEKDMHSQFISRICNLDDQGELYALLWQQFAGPIRLLLDNRYVFQPFWDQLNDPKAKSDWQERFEQARRKANRALGQKDTAEVLLTVLMRLYTLRNQLMHGGATWNGSVNRAQVRDGRAILDSVLPVILTLMMRKPERFQGEPFYPVVEG